MNTLEQAKALLNCIDAGHHDHNTLSQAVEVLRKMVDGVESQGPVYQISLADGPTSTAWIDCSEADYNSARLMTDFKCRQLYAAAAQEGK